MDKVADGTGFFCLDHSSYCGSEHSSAHSDSSLCRQLLIRLPRRDINTTHSRCVVLSMMAPPREWNVATVYARLRDDF